MKKHYSLKNALEQFQNELIEVDQNPGINQETADLAEDEGADDLRDSSDLGDDVSSLVTASESLESLAEALDSDMFPNHAASKAELQSVKFALESYGLEAEAATVKEGESKGSLKDRVMKGARAVWDWLVGIGKKIATWVSEVFTRMTKPVMMYEKRMEEVVKKSSGELKEVSGDKYAKQLGTSKKLPDGIKDLAAFVTQIATANSYVNATEFLSEIEKKGHADGAAIVTMLNKMQENFLKAYPEDRDGKYYSHMMIGGNVFMMDIGSESTINWDHGHTQEKAEKAPSKLTASDIGDLNKAIIAGVLSWKQAQASVANMKIKKVADNIQRIGKTYKGELNAQAKSALKVMPKMLKSPAVDAALVIMRVMGAAVSFAEAHVSGSAAKDSPATTKTNKSTLTPVTPINDKDVSKNNVSLSPKELTSNVKRLSQSK